MPVRRADDAFPKTENIAIMTAEICAVQPSSGALYSRTRAPRPLRACAHRLPSVARRTGHVKGTGTSSSADRKLRQALQPANGTPPPPPLPPCTWHARAKHVPSTSRATQTPQRTTAAHLSTQLSGTPQTTAADCRRLPLPRSSSRRLALLPCRRQLKTIPVTDRRN